MLFYGNNQKTLNNWDFVSRVSSKISVIGVQDFTPVADPSILLHDHQLMVVDIVSVSLNTATCPDGIY